MTEALEALCWAPRRAGMVKPPSAAPRRRPHGDAPRRFPPARPAAADGAAGFDLRGPRGARWGGALPGGELGAARGRRRPLAGDEGGPGVRAGGRQLLRGGGGSTCRLRSSASGPRRRASAGSPPAPRWCCTPRNPYVPTVHLNYRYFEAGPVWWFGRRRRPHPLLPVP